MRSTLAVLAGFIVWTALFLATNQITSRIFSDRFDENLVTTDTTVLALTLALTVVYSVLAGWVTAKVASTRPVWHGVVLGVVQTVIGVAVQAGFWGVLPHWYNVLFVLFLFPATVAGARLVSGTETANVATSS